MLSLLSMTTPRYSIALTFSKSPPSICRLTSSNVSFRLFMTIHFVFATFNLKLFTTRASRSIFADFCTCQQLFNEDSRYKCTTIAKSSLKVDSMLIEAGKSYWERNQQIFFIDFFKDHCD